MLAARSLAIARCSARACLGPGLLAAPRPSGAATYARRPGVAAMASAAGGASAAPAYSLLLYSYVPDILEKRGPYREQHLAGAQAKLAAGKLVCAGASGDPVDGAVFLFKDSTREEIEAFVQADPYVANGLVPSWSIKPYTVVVGAP